MPNLGNGYMGMQFGRPWMFVSGVFNGEKGQSHRAHIPTPFNVGLAPHPDSVALDFEYGTVEQIYRWPRAAAIQRTYFHQALPRVAVTELEVDNSHGNETLTVELTDTLPTEFADLRAEQRLGGGDHWCMQFRTKKAESPRTDLIGVALCRSDPPPRLEVPARRSTHVVWLSTVWTSRDSLPSGVASALVAADAELRDVSRRAPEELRRSHAVAMRRLWRSGIEIEGNRDLAKTVNSSWWNLLLSYRVGQDMSSSPGGLANTCYKGHSFWDVEQFMWPNLLVFHPRLAASSLRYRFDRRGAAAANAKAWHLPGLKFPWESAVTGEEVCPWQNGWKEIHISGDVSLSFWQYWQATGDRAWLRDVGWPVLSGVADFWAHRTKAVSNGGFSIRDVVDVDEGAGIVADSAYTNAVAKLALSNALKAARVMGRQQPPGADWHGMAQGIPILLDPSGHHHPEYAGATAGNGLGVLMMQYPLGMPAAWPDGWTEQVRRNDLAFYGHRRSANAMFWWLFAILWLELGEPDLASKFLAKTTAHNVWGPFHIWSERPDGGGCPNFVTGAGAYLQVFWAGYAGVRLGDTELSFHSPRVPPGASGLRLRALSYRGSLVNVRITRDKIYLQLHEASPRGSPELVATNSHSNETSVLGFQRPFVFPASGVTSLRAKSAGGG